MASSFFDPEDIVSKVDPASTGTPIHTDDTTVPPTAPTNSFFDPEDVEAGQQMQKAQPTTTSAPAQKQSFFDPNDVISVVKPSPNPSPSTFGYGIVSDDELASIAKKRGVDIDWLKDVAPLYGASTEPHSALDVVTGTAKTGFGTIGGALTFNIPQKIFQKLQDKNYQDALDDIKDLANAKQGIGVEGLKMVTSLKAPIGFLGKATKGAGAAAKIAAGTAEGAGIGAAAGAANAHSGEEGTGALHGAAFGAVLGGVGSAAIEGLGAGNRFLQGAREANPEAAVADINKGAQEIADRYQASDGIMKDMITGDKSALNDGEINTLLHDQLSPAEVDAIHDPSSMENHAASEQAGDSAHSDQAVRGEVADDILSDRTEAFAQYLEGGKKPGDLQQALDTIEAYKDRQGGTQALTEKYDQFMNEFNAARWQSETGTITNKQPGWLAQKANSFSANKFVLRHLDDKYNVGAEDALQNVNQAKSRLTYARQLTRGGLDDVSTAARKAGVDNDLRFGGKIYNAIESGTTAELAPAEKAVADKVSDYFEKVRDFANGDVSKLHPDVTPLSIPETENYIPHVIKQSNELVPLVEKKIDQSLQAASSLTGRNITQLSQLSVPEYRTLQKQGIFQDLVDYLNVGRSKTQEFDRPGDLGGALNEKLYSAEGKGDIQSQARAAEARTGELPDWMLEKNVYRLMDSYAHNTLNHLYLRKPLDQIAGVATKLSTIGAKPESAFVQRLGQDIMGTRSGTAAEAGNKYAVWVNRNLDKMIDKYGENSVQATGLKVAKTLPYMIDWASRQIYGNTIGYNMHSVLMHLGASVARIPSEIGGAYGYSTMAKAAVRVVSDVNGTLERAESLGNIPAEFTRKGQRALADGVRASLPVSMATKTADTISQVGMFAFQQGEKMNRRLIIGAADQISADLASANPYAQRTIQSFPRFVQEQVAAAGGDTQKTSDVLARYLNDSTIFQYNRANMYEFGRTMGKFFSTFSTWPTSLYGEALYEMRSKGIGMGGLRTIERLGVPFALLTAVGHVIHGSTDQMSDRDKKIFGAKGLGGLAPAGALGEFASGKVFTPPAVSVASHLIQGAIEGKSQAVGQAADQAAALYVPGMGITRFITQDLPTLINNRKPGGKTLLEKTENGFRSLTK